MPSPKITLRPPSTTTPTPSTFTPPPLSFLLRTWHVTHSTLPMWKKAHNVQITYSTSTPVTRAPTTPNSTSPKLNDTVTYQPHSSSKTKTISGIDTPAGPGAWNWRGKGWLMIAGSHWEVLGFGGGEEEGGQGTRWVVTFFERTMFTPAGIDFYASDEEGLDAEVVEGLKRALEEVDCEVVRGLVGGIFEVGR